MNCCNNVMMSEIIDEYGLTSIQEVHDCDLGLSVWSCDVMFDAIKSRSS